MAFFFWKELIAFFLVLLIVFNAEARNWRSKSGKVTPCQPTAPQEFNCPTLGSSQHWVDETGKVIITYESITAPLCGIEHVESNCILSIDQVYKHEPVEGNGLDCAGSFELKKVGGTCCLTWSPRPCSKHFALIADSTSTPPSNLSPSPTPFGAYPSVHVYVGVGMACVLFFGIAIFVGNKYRVAYRASRLVPVSEASQSQPSCRDNYEADPTSPLLPQDTEYDSYRRTYLIEDSDNRQRHPFSINADCNDVSLSTSTEEDEYDNNKAEIDFSLKGMPRISDSDNFVSIFINGNTIKLFRKESEDGEISKEGGTIRLPDSGIELVVPPNAIKEQACRLSLSLYARKTILLPNDRTAVIEVIEVFPHKKEFEKRLTIRRPLMHYHKCSGKGIYSFFYGDGSDFSEKYDYMGSTRKRPINYKKGKVRVTATIEENSYQLRFSTFCHYATVFSIGDSFDVFLQMFAERGIKVGPSKCQWTLKSVLSCACSDVVQKTAETWQARRNLVYRGEGAFECKNRGDVANNQHLDIALNENMENYDSWKLLETITFTGRELIGTVLREKSKIGGDKGNVVTFTGDDTDEATTDKIQLATFCGKLFDDADTKDRAARNPAIQLSEIPGRPIIGESRQQHDGSLPHVMPKGNTTPEFLVAYPPPLATVASVGFLKQDITRGMASSIVNECSEPPSIPVTVETNQIGKQPREAAASSLPTSDRHLLPEEINTNLKMAVAELAQGRWQRLLLCLGLNERVTSQYQEQRDHIFRVCSIISDWKLEKGREASVSNLVAACIKIGISEDEIVKEYKCLTRGEGPR